MSCDRTLPEDIGGAIERIRGSCCRFYSRHEKLLYSIVLAGSLARREVPEEDADYDADILVVTRHYYNPILCGFLKKYLEKNVKNVKLDFGRSYPLSRLRKEKSLFLYDIKNNGVILAGNDVKEIIREHTLEDLYPFEAIRLLLNASCRLAFSLSQEDTEITRELNKTMRCCIDAYLLHHDKFAPTLKERKAILKRDYSKCFGTIQDVVECDDLDLKYTMGRQEFLRIMNLMRKRLGLDSLKSLIDHLQERSEYSFSLRLYTLAMSRHFRSICRNPIFDVYTWALSVLWKCEKITDIKSHCPHYEYFRSVWTRLPQPLVYA